MTEATSPEGLLLVDKPAGYTSHDVVATVRRLARTRRVGHAGTLDPMATGVLVLGIGRATKLLTFLVGCDKGYAATIRLGVATVTDDAEGEVSAVRSVPEGVADRVPAAVAALTGAITQVPSSVSAIKVDGRRSYDRARAGESVELAARPVRVEAFEVTGVRRAAATTDLDVRVAVSSGTYVRALARDLGAALGVGGHLTALRRTRVGPFAVAEATDLEAPELLAPADVASRLFPVWRMDAEQTVALAQGKRVAADVPDGEVVAALAPDGRLAGLVRVDSGVARVVVNFPEQEVPA